MFASILREFFRILIRVLAVKFKIFKILQNFKATEFYKILKLQNWVRNFMSALKLAMKF
ncbi:MAG: hypothetical protein ACLVCW_07135 [Campylobacter sp.]